MEAYPFQLFPEEHFYLFKTRYNIRYAIRFKPSFYVLDADPVIADNVYESIIAQIEKPEGSIPPDEQIFIPLLPLQKIFSKKRKILLYMFVMTATGKGKHVNVNLTDGSTTLILKDGVL